MFVLDTNVFRSGKPQQSANVRKWAAQQTSAQLYLSAISIFELEMSVRALKRRVPPQGGALRLWLDQV